MSDNSNGSYKNVLLETLEAGELTKGRVKVLGQKVDDRCPFLALLRASGCVIKSSWNKI